MPLRPQACSIIAISIGGRSMDVVAQTTASLQSLLARLSNMEAVCRRRRMRRVDEGSFSAEGIERTKLVRRPGAGPVIEHCRVRVHVRLRFNEGCLKSSKIVM